MNDDLIKIAAQAMRVSEEDARRNHKAIDGVGAYYFWNPIRGGIAVIVAENGEKLAAASSISYKMHLQAFLSGKRN